MPPAQPSHPTAPAGWQPAPGAVAVLPGSAHVFRMPLDSVSPARLAALYDLLSPDERARAARLRVETARLRFIAAHGQVREILSACLEGSRTTTRAPAALAFTHNLHGKPGLVESQGLAFNISHSHDLGLAAVTVGREIGVDVELVRDELDRANIARRFFAPAEVEALFALPEALQPRAFYDCWTRKEAYIKARGIGMAIGLGQFTVSLDPASPARLLTADPGIADKETWSLHAIEPGAGYTAALAVQGGLESITCWDWGAGRGN